MQTARLALVISLVVAGCASARTATKAQGSSQIAPIPSSTADTSVWHELLRPANRIPFSDDTALGNVILVTFREATSEQARAQVVNSVHGRVVGRLGGQPAGSAQGFEVVRLPNVVDADSLTKLILRVGMSPDVRAAIPYFVNHQLVAPSHDTL